MRRTLLLALALFAPCAVPVIASSWAGWSDTTSRTVTASTTQYAYLLGPGAAFTLTESSRQQAAPGDGYLSNLYITTVSSQPASGSLVCNVRVAGADADADGAGLTVTVAANAAAGTFTTAGGSIRVKQGQLVDLKCVNNATATSAGISDLRLLLN